MVHLPRCGLWGGGGARVVAAYEMPRPCVRDVKQASLISLMAKNYTNIVQDSVLQHEVSRVRTVTTQDQSQKAKRDACSHLWNAPAIWTHDQMLFFAAVKLQKLA